jgi:hypothetical protein
MIICNLLKETHIFTYFINDIMKKKVNIKERHRQVEESSSSSDSIISLLEENLSDG